MWKVEDCIRETESEEPVHGELEHLLWGIEHGNGTMGTANTCECWCQGMEERGNVRGFRGN